MKNPLVEKYAVRVSSIFDSSDRSSKAVDAVAEAALRYFIVATAAILKESAPVTSDPKVVRGHYARVSKLFGRMEMLAEDAGMDSVKREIADSESRFKNYTIRGPQQYQVDVCKAISQVVNTWLSARNEWIKKRGES